MDGQLNFFSISGDGRVSNWTIIKTRMSYKDMIVIDLGKSLQNIGQDSVGDVLKDSGSAIAFKPDDDNLFLVGTDDGQVYLCTTEYSSKYLETYPAHNTPVYKIEFNTYNNDIFITCASELIIKIWDKDWTKPLYSFDLNTQVA